MVTMFNNNKTIHISSMIKVIFLILLTFTIIMTLIPLFHLPISPDYLQLKKPKYVRKSYHHSNKSNNENHKENFQSIINKKETIDNKIINTIDYYEESAISFLIRYSIYYNLFDQFNITNKYDDINMKLFRSKSSGKHVNIY